MFKFNSSNTTQLKRLQSKLEDAESVFPKVITKTLNNVSFKARLEVNAEASRVFQNPTNMIKNAAYVKAAKASQPYAVVHIKETPPKGGTNSPADVLFPHVEGGRRYVKGLEVGLRARQLLRRLSGSGIPRDTHFVPGEGLDLNKFGNITPAKVKRILKETKKPGGKFFMFIPEGRRYPLVMHQRTKGAVPEVALVGIATPKYRKRFAFHKVVERTFSRHYANELEEQLDANLPASDL